MAEITMRERIQSAISAAMPPMISLTGTQERAIVDAVLAAMMEPTEEMIYAGEQAINANIMGEPGPEDECVSAWKAMIEVAQRLPIQQVPILDEVPE